MVIGCYEICGHLLIDFCKFLVAFLACLYHPLHGNEPLPLLWAWNWHLTLKYYVTSSGKTWLTEGQKEQALIRHLKFCAVSIYSLDILSHMSIDRIFFSRFLQNLILLPPNLNMSFGTTFTFNIILAFRKQIIE